MTCLEVFAANWTAMQWLWGVREKWVKTFRKKSFPLYLSCKRAMHLNDSFHILVELARIDMRTTLKPSQVHSPGEPHMPDQAQGILCVQSFSLMPSWGRNSLFESGHKDMWLGICVSKRRRNYINSSTKCFSMLFHFIFSQIVWKRYYFLLILYFRDLILWEIHKGIAPIRDWSTM